MTYNPRVRTAAGNAARLSGQASEGPATPFVRASIAAGIAGNPAGPRGGIADRLARRVLGMDRCDCRHLAEHKHGCGVTAPNPCKEADRG